MMTQLGHSLGASHPGLRTRVPAPVSVGRHHVHHLGRRHSRSVLVREAVVTEVLTREPEAVDVKLIEPKHEGTGHHTNGNGNGNGLHAKPAAAAVPTVMPSRAAIDAATAVVAATVAQNAYTAAESAASSNGNGVHSPAAVNKVVAASPAASVAMGSVSDDESSLVAGSTTNTRRLNKSGAGTPYSSAGGRWSNFKEYSTFQRTFQVWSFAFQFAFKYAMISKKFTYGKLGMTKDAVSARKTEVAIWLRDGLVRLGPTFIKVGQQFSTRVDVLSPEFIKELEQLQDNVPAFDSATALDIVQFSLGKPVLEVFDSFESVPMAAASLGQVHLASLNGEKVVVKVQRPGLKALFDIDLKNIRTLAVWLQKLDPKTDGAARDWVAIYDECSRILYEEIDYTLEGKNADMFRENFKDTSWVKVPRVIWQYTSPEVLVLEYVPGVKINDGEAIDALGLDRKKLARLSVESYLQQILRHGLFHADPHPGNVAVDAVGGGRLIYYDFGMMGTIKPQVKDGLLELFYGVYQKDPEKCLDALQTMGVYLPTGDRTAVRRTAAFFLKAFSERLDTQKKEREAKGKVYEADFKPQRSKDESKTRRKQILSTIGEDLLVAANDQPFRFPAAFTFVVRSFTVLDGIGKSLDPRFDISEIAAPYARELLLDSSPQAARVAKALAKGLSNQNRAVFNLFKGPNQIEDVSLLLGRLERGDLKLRVRALEAERALSRVQVQQKLVLAAVMASALVNLGTVLSLNAMTTGANAAFAVAAFFGLQMLKGYFQVNKLEQKELQLTGAM